MNSIISNYISKRTNKLIILYKEKIKNIVIYHNLYNIKTKQELLDSFHDKDSSIHLVSKNNIKIISEEQIEMTTILPVDNDTRVNMLEEHLSLSKIKHDEQIMKITNLKDAHIYCIIYHVSAQQYGPLLEKFIRIKFDYIKNKSKDCVGDCSKYGKNIEIKVSLGGETHTKFNFVQIRPSHKCDIYLLTAYHLSTDNVKSQGELYIFQISKEEIKKIISLYGTYAHGTIKEHGKITIETLNDETNIKEYALRTTINDDLWMSLLKYRIFESDI